MNVAGSDLEPQDEVILVARYMSSVSELNVFANLLA